MPGNIAIFMEIKGIIMFSADTARGNLAVDSTTRTLVANGCLTKIEKLIYKESRYKDCAVVELPELYVEQEPNVDPPNESEVLPLVIKELQTLGYTVTSTRSKFGYPVLYISWKLKN